MTNTTESIIILNAESISEQQFSLSTISIDAFVKMPFKIRTFNCPYAPKFGDMFEIVNNNTLTLKQPYITHIYEIATVIGRNENGLLVYGNKTGEIIIPNYTYSHINSGNALFDIQRGDDLLLSEYSRAKFGILANITKEKMKYAASMRIK